MFIRYDKKAPIGFSLARGLLKKTEMSFEIYPEGLYYILKDLDRRYSSMPIYITENGISIKDKVVGGKIDDWDRIKYLNQHLKVCVRAIKEGVNLRGYFVWSFMDCFEWTNGYTKRFGLIYINYKNRRESQKLLLTSTQNLLEKILNVIIYIF